MRPRICFLAVYVCSAAIAAAQATGGSSQSTSGSAQSTSGSSQSSSSSSSSSSSADRNRKTYVRRIGIGATLSVTGLELLSGGSSSTTATPNAATSVTTDTSTSAASSRIGYGLTAQAAITEHFALAVGGYLRRMGYTSGTTVTTNLTTFINGAQQTTTTITSTHDDVRTRLIDIPVMIRYYQKGRHTPGARWFAEGGGAYRDVENIRSSRYAVDNSGTITCCTNNVVQPAHKTSRGFAAGFGAQFIDPFGIRVVPEVRYIRWVTPIFSDATTHMQRNQVEVDLTLSF
ncbi:MAG TPA: hypothetical protein VKX49_04865 [Bryobacteraceae bacterium]|nr:hypothetical protein [Bryobacteraceae bacterium]